MSDFVVNVMEDAVSLISVLKQVAQYVDEKFLKGRMFQTASKEILRPSENLKLLFRSSNFFQPILQNSNFLGRSSPIQSIPPVIY